MSEMIYDYESKTIAEAMEKHGIPVSWEVQIDVFEEMLPYIVVPVSLLQINPDMLKLVLRTGVDPDEDIPGCLVDMQARVVTFALERLEPLRLAMATWDDAVRLHVLPNRAQGGFTP